MRARPGHGSARHAIRRLLRPCASRRRWRLRGWWRVSRRSVLSGGSECPCGRQEVPPASGHPAWSAASCLCRLRFDVALGTGEAALWIEVYADEEDRRRCEDATGERGIERGVGEPERFLYRLGVLEDFLEERDAL